MHRYFCNRLLRISHVNHERFHFKHLLKRFKTALVKAVIHESYCELESIILVKNEICLEVIKHFVLGENSAVIAE